MHTDANGQAWVTLIPNELYKINITKTGYIDSLADMIPIDSETPSDREYTFRILPEPSVVIDIESFYDTIIFTAVMNDAGYLSLGNITITYDDTNSTTTDTQIYLFDVWNDTVTFLDMTSNVSEQNFTYKVSGINTTHLHYATLYFNNSNEFDVSSPITITIKPLYTMRGTSTSDLDTRITNVVGPFGWDVHGDFVTTGWHNVVALILPFLFLLGFGVYNIGAGILACGVSMGLVQIIYAMWFTNSLNPLFILLCPVVIAVAVLVLWTKGRGEDNA